MEASAALEGKPPRALRVAFDAFLHFQAADGWAIASHIALTALMSLFPFLIVVTALAASFDSREVAEQARRILFETLPIEVAGPVSREIERVATSARSGPLTFGAVWAVYFASSGVESLRIALNRAYGITETRPWWRLRLESILYMLAAAAGLLVLSVLVVLGPLLFLAILRYAPWLAPFELVVAGARLAFAAIVLGAALVAAHYWLPGGKLRFSDIVPGVLVTLVLWLAAAVAFGRYLAAFPEHYVLTYAGLASAMVALVFLYFLAAIFLYGGELNAAIMRATPDDWAAAPRGPASPGQ